MEKFELTPKDIRSFRKIYPREETAKTSHKKDEIFYCGDQLLCKTFFNKKNDYITNKMKSVISLMEMQADMEVSSINYPLGTLSIDGKEYGYVMPAIKGRTLDSILSDPNISFDKKKEYLMKAGKAIEEMKEARQETGIENFFINDLHGRNFMVDRKGNVKVIDVDSFAIKDNDIAPAMFLRPIVRLTGYEKYNHISKGCMGSQITPSYDTDVYCYSLVILSYLFGEKVTYMHEDELNKYLTYLELLGYDKELINLFRRLYSEKENVNPYELVPEMFDTKFARRNEFIRVRKKIK